MTAIRIFYEGTRDGKSFIFWTRKDVTEKWFFLESAKEGTIKLVPGPGNLLHYSEIIIDIMENEEKFLRNVNHVLNIQEKEIKQIDAEFSGQIIHIKKGVSPKRIMEAYRRTSLFEGYDDKEVTA